MHSRETYYEYSQASHLINVKWFGASELSMRASMDTMCTLLLQLRLTPKPNQIILEPLWSRKSFFKVYAFDLAAIESRTRRLIRMVRRLTGSRNHQTLFGREKTSNI